MGDPPRRSPSNTRLPHVVEQNVAPQLVAKPLPRRQTPIGMPAPPATAPERESHDDLEHVLQIEKLERDRAQLLVELQDAKDAQESAEQQARQLRTPTAAFPPPSIPPPEAKKSVAPVESAEIDIKALEKALAHSRIGRAAVGLGILVALGWNAFNSVRSDPQRVDSVQTRMTQSEKDRDQKLVADAMEKQRTLQALRAIECWGKQLRGASARQGLDLPSLPPGGVTAQRLDQGDPSKHPAFVVAEPCPNFPKLPPEQPGAAP